MGVRQRSSWRGPLVPNGCPGQADYAAKIQYVTLTIPTPATMRRFVAGLTPNTAISPWVLDRAAAGHGMSGTGKKNRGPAKLKATTFLGRQTPSSAAMRGTSRTVASDRT